MKLALQYRCFETVRMSGVLHDGATHGGVAAHEQGDANHALVPHDGDLRGFAIFHDVEQGDYAVRREIRVSHGFAGFIQDLTELEGYQLEMIGKARALRGWQSGKQ